MSPSSRPPSSTGGTGGTGGSAARPSGLIPHDAHLRCDVLVIGSGAGGATTAAELAEAGFDVLVVEEGPWVDQDAVVPFSLEQMDRQYRSGGVTVALGMPSIAYTEGRCAGGGTEVNSGLYFRPPLDVVEQWRHDFRIDGLDLDELGAIADEVERTIHVTTVPGSPTPASEILRRGAAALGWRHSEIPRRMRYPLAWRRHRQRQIRPAPTRPGLPPAPACSSTPGADRLTTMGSVVNADVTYGDGTGRTAGLIAARHVFVCGGAIQTPALLQRSGMRRHIGATLAVHPTVKLTAAFDDEINVPDDVPVHQGKEFAPDLSFGGSASHAGLGALALSDEWGTVAAAIEQWRRMSIYYAAITSEGRGRVVALPGLRDPLVTYHLTGRDRHLLRSGLARLALLMLESGANEVYPSFRGAPVVRNRRDLATMQHRFRASRAGVMTVHLCSTVPLGEHGGRCGADSFGQVGGTERIFVNDASLLPTAPGVNPQATVMVFASATPGTSPTPPTRFERPEEHHVSDASLMPSRPSTHRHGRAARHPASTTVPIAGAGWMARPGRDDDRLLADSWRNLGARTGARRRRPSLGPAGRRDRSRGGRRRRRRRAADRRCERARWHTADADPHRRVIHPKRWPTSSTPNAQGTPTTSTRRWQYRGGAGWYTSSNSPFGTNPAPPTCSARQPAPPYYGYGRSKMEAELSGLRRRADRGLTPCGAAAVVLRSIPAATADDVLPDAGGCGKFPIIGGGQQRRSMVYVDNLVDGILAAEATPGATGKGYWIADARPYTVVEIVDTVGRALAAEGFEVRGGGTKMPALVGRVAETADALIQRVGRYQQQLHVLGEMDKTIACDISASRTELGYEPRVELYEGMRRSIRWCVERGLEL
ncbi:MAG: GMC family oxidoreductase N-terminal domain-containing protein [Ilumatobacteraceae bacterium]